MTTQSSLHSFLNMGDKKMKDLNTKMDTILANTNKTSTDVRELTIKINAIQNDISQCNSLKDTTSILRYELQAARGKIAKLEIREQQMATKLQTLESKLYDKDIIFYNIPEEKEQSPYNLRSGIYNLLRQGMGIPEQLLISTENPTGEIRIDYAQRLGKFRLNNTRPVLVRFVTRSGKDVIMQKKYLDKLRSLTDKVSVSENFPAEVREKRTALFPTFKELKNDHKDSKVKVVLSKDKILMDKVPIGISTSMFEKNTLPKISPLTTSNDHLVHSQILSERNSFFQAHKTLVCNTEQSSAALSALYRNASIAESHHIMYAYSFIQDNQTVTGHSDDGEIGGSKILEDLIVETKTNNIFLCVSRQKHGSNIGKQRFELIKKNATEVLRMPNIAEDTSKLYTKIDTTD